MIKVHSVRQWSVRVRALATAGAVLVGSLAAGVLIAPAAHADPTVRALTDINSRWAPYNTASPYGSYYYNNQTFTISCYVTGDAVGGPYGTETIWDMVSGSGDFVPDALVYTGSNSAVVPRCPTAVGRAIGSSTVGVYYAPSLSQMTPYYSLAVGDRTELRCYTTGDSVSGPYGTENIWDQVTFDYGYQALYVPDALIYTGSNSAVVPHC